MKCILTQTGPQSNYQAEGQAMTAPSMLSKAWTLLSHSKACAFHTFQYSFSISTHMILLQFHDYVQKGEWCVVWGVKMSAFPASGLSGIKAGLQVVVLVQDRCPYNCTTPITYNPNNCTTSASRLPASWCCQARNMAKGRLSELQALWWSEGNEEDNRFHSNDRRLYVVFEEEGLDLNIQTLALNFPVSVVKILISKIHSCNNWQENGCILFWGFKIKSVSNWRQKMKSKLPSEWVQTKRCKLRTPHSSNLHSWCGMAWYGTLGVNICHCLVHAIRVFSVRSTFIFSFIGLWFQQMK